jgi:hypothetical protein
VIGTARVVLDVTNVERASSGSVLAGIWLRIDGRDFPDTGWEDFAVSVLTWWVGASLRLLTGKPGPAELRFLDGPYLVELERSVDDAWRLKLVQDRSSGKVTQTAIIDPKPLLLSMVAAADSMLAICRARGWENHESTALAGYVSDLRAWIHPQ